MPKTVKIKCTGTDNKSIDELTEFQGDLKKITKKNLEKLKNNIIDNGFIAPIFIWKDGKQNKIIDGHQRLKALIQLRKEKYGIPVIPVVYIEADNEKDARKKLLAVSSQYGDFEIVEAEEWLKEFGGNNLRLFTSESVEKKFNPEMNPKQANKIVTETEIEKTQDKMDVKYDSIDESEEVVCPECGMTFHVKR